jgi:hypothetical protein
MAGPGYGRAWWLHSPAPRRPGIAPADPTTTFWGLGRRSERCPLDDPGLTSGTWFARGLQLPADSPAVWESVPALAISGRPG